jgi:hypothetical protein
MHKVEVDEEEATGWKAPVVHEPKPASSSDDFLFSTLSLVSGKVVDIDVEATGWKAPVARRPRPASGSDDMFSTLSQTVATAA